MTTLMREAIGVAVILVIAVTATVVENSASYKEARANHPQLATPAAPDTHAALSR